MFNAKKLKIARRKAEISQENLARAMAVYGIDVSRNTINSWEQGRTVPGANKLMAIAELLGVSISSFFDKKGA